MLWFKIFHNIKSCFTKAVQQKHCLNVYKWVLHNSYQTKTIVNNLRFTKYYAQDPINAPFQLSFHLLQAFPTQTLHLEART